MLIEQCFNLTNLIQMWRRTLNQCAFRRKLTVINWFLITVQIDFCLEK
ncbi:hypothetical protein T06_13652 [Trichinella sp. T6]|nr:hypothetical protein T06_13652 [Trichinella sp. T6]